MIKNIEAGFRLIHLYRSISIEKIKNKVIFNSTHYQRVRSIKALTGLGDTQKCLLCTGLGEVSSCKHCIYSYKLKTPIQKLCSCIDGKYRKTYKAIKNSNTAEELHKAYNNRADQIEKLIGRILGIKISKQKYISIALSRDTWLDLTQDYVIGGYDDLIRYVNTNRVVVLNDGCVSNTTEFWYSKDVDV